MRPIIHLRQLLPSLMILMFLLDLVDLQDLRDLLDRQHHHQDGLQFHRLLMRVNEWDLERTVVSGYLCDRHHPSPNSIQLR